MTDEAKEPETQETPLDVKAGWADAGSHYVATEGKHIVKLWTKGVPVEHSAYRQIQNVATLPFIYRHVAVMADAHWGRGATIGSVIATKGAIVPAAVGVDLGCGVDAVLTNLVASDLPDNLSAIRSAIEAAVPHGRTNNGQRGDRGAWGSPPNEAELAWRAPDPMKKKRTLEERFSPILEKYPKMGGTTIEHLGTMGTGNHYFEVCVDTDQKVWIMVHSGSRGVGNRIGSFFIDRAKRDMERWFISLPDHDLAYLAEGTESFDDYIEAVEWAQDFARASRSVMMGRAMEAMEKTLGRPVEAEDTAVHCSHNYIAHENHFGQRVWVTRKGAVRAGKGELGVIPGSMGTKSYIVRGKGNVESFCSCSHGAGRRMSRTEARRRFSVEDHRKATEGVNCRKDEDVIDETPMAYKDIDAVMAAQTDLVDIVATLKAVVCVKG